MGDGSLNYLCKQIAADEGRARLWLRAGAGSARGGVVFCPGQAVAVGSHSWAALRLPDRRTDSPQAAAGRVGRHKQQRVCKGRRRIGGPLRGTAGSSWLSGPRAPRRAPRLWQPCPWAPWFAHGDPNPEVPGGWGRKGALLRCPASLQGLLPLPRLLCKLGFAHLSGAGELQGQG